MLDVEKIVKIINKLGYKTYTFDYSVYKNYIYTMLHWYQNSVPNFHREKEFNGYDYHYVDKARLGMAKRASEDKASLVFNDNLQVYIEDKDVNNFLLGYDENKGILGESDFWSLSSKLYEISSALGTGAIEIVLKNLLNFEGDLIANENTKIELCSHDATEIIPLSWNNNLDIKEVCFVDQYSVKNSNDNIVELRCHLINEDTGNYFIINKKIKVVSSNSDTIDDFIFLDNSNVVDYFDTKSNIPWFSIIKTSVVNNTYLHCPMGASIYGNCIDILKNIDDAFNALSKEFRFADKKIFYSTKMLNRDPETDKVIIPEDTNRSVFFYMNDESGMLDKEYIHEFNPNLRIKEISDGIDNLLNYYSIMVGLGNNYYKFSNSGGIKTATEVVSEDSELFRNIKKDQIASEKFLLSLFKALIYVNNLTHGTKMDINANIAIHFDQSIIEDKQGERARALEEVKLGLMTDDEYRERYILANRRDSATLKSDSEVQ